MPSLPAYIICLWQPFAALLAAPTWRKAQVLLVGAMLGPGQRTVSSALQVLGLHAQRVFARYHHVLSRAVWSSLAVSRALLGLLVQHLGLATGPLCLGIDETIERRKGPRIAAKGVYRDGVRSSHGHFVKAMGLRWVSLMWLVQLPWTRRVWALPFLTVLAPSTRCPAERGRRHKTVTDWARQRLCCVRRWCPDHALVVVGDRGYAALRLLAACQQMSPAATFLTRLRQRWPDGAVRHLQYASATAVWYHAGQPPVPLRRLLVRDPAQSQELQALLSTDSGLAGPLQWAGTGHPCPASRATRRPPAVGLVHPAAPHLRRCAGFHAPDALAPNFPFSHVAAPGQPPKTGAASASPDYGSPLLHPMKVQSRAK